MPASFSFALGRQGGNVALRAAAADQDPAGEDGAKPEDRMQDGGFAGAVRTDQTQRLSLADAQVEAVQDLHLAIAGAQIPKLEIGFALDQALNLLDRHRFGDRLGFAVDVVDRDDGVDLAAVVAGGPARRGLRGHGSAFLAPVPAFSPAQPQDIVRHAAGERAGTVQIISALPGRRR